MSCTGISASEQGERRSPTFTINSELDYTSVNLTGYRSFLSISVKGVHPDHDGDRISCGLKSSAFVHPDHRKGRKIQLTSIRYKYPAADEITALLTTLILDFDGTIVESLPLKAAAFQKIFSFTPKHLDEIIAFHLENGGMSRYDKFRHIYANILHLTDHFFYHKRLIHAGKRETDGLTLYLFEDADLAVEEQKTLYRLFEEGEIDRETLNKRLKRSGRILILSSIVTEPQGLYEMYKSRNLVENHFAAFKGLIQADKLYLRDATAVFGHLFIGFLCLYIYCQILNRIKKAGLSAHLSPHGLLLKLSKVYAVTNEENRWITEVPKQVKQIVERLKLDIFPNG